jgi:hypothetical protein
MSANTASFPIEETTIAALHAAYLSGRATAVSVCQAHLDRIAAYDRSGSALGAIIINNPDALADAAALDAALALTAANVVCPGYVRTPLVDKQIPEQAEALGISEEEVVHNVMLHETVDGEFTTTDDVAAAALFFAAAQTNALTGQSLIVSRGWFME